MVEAFAVASGKGGTGKTTSTLALGMALAEEHDVTVVDADTGMANLLFHAGLDDATVTLHDLLVEGTATAVSEATYDRFGLSVVPCGTSLAGFEAAEPGRFREVVAELASDTDVRCSTRRPRSARSRRCYRSSSPTASWSSSSRRYPRSRTG